MFAGLNGRDRLEGPVDINTFLAHAIGTGNIEYDQAADDEARQRPERSHCDPASHGRKQEGGDNEPEQEEKRDDTHDGDHR